MVSQSEFDPLVAGAPEVLRALSGFAVLRSAVPFVWLPFIRRMGQALRAGLRRYGEWASLDDDPLNVFVMWLEHFVVCSWCLVFFCFFSDLLSELRAATPFIWQPVLRSLVMPVCMAPVLSELPFSGSLTGSDPVHPALKQASPKRASNTVPT